MPDATIQTHLDEALRDLAAADEELAAARSSLEEIALANVRASMLVDAIRAVRDRRAVRVETLRAVMEATGVATREQNARMLDLVAAQFGPMQVTVVTENPDGSRTSRTVGPPPN